MSVSNGARPASCSIEPTDLQVYRIDVDVVRLRLRRRILESWARCSYSCFTFVIGVVLTRDSRSARFDSLRSSFWLDPQALRSPRSLRIWFTSLATRRTLRAS